jgi:membrane associated rhomboid family serine protease
LARAAEPAFNITPGTGWLIAANLLVHLVRLALPAELDEGLLLALGFAPSAFLLPGYGFYWPESAFAWLSPVGYGFLHGDVFHLLVNVGFLLAFGTLLERRIGTRRMLALYFATLVLSVAGATIAYWITVQPVLMIGASGAVAGLFGGAARFAFPKGRGMAMGLVFIGINLAFGLIGMTDYGGVREIAWEAHVAGFLAGAALFPLFDRRRWLPPPPPPSA